MKPTTTEVETVIELQCCICQFAEKRTIRPLSIWPEPDLCIRCSTTAEHMARWLVGSKWRAKRALWRLAEAMAERMEGRRRK